MSDLISRAAMLRLLDENGVVFRGKIEKFPAVDAAPVVHGRWVEKRWSTDGDWGVINHRALVCTACSVEIDDGEKTPYCPYCGAKMDKEG